MGKRYISMDKDIDATAEECRRNAARLQKRASDDPDFQSKSRCEKLAKEWLQKAAESENDLA
jgi:hypothetical protein